MAVQMGTFGSFTTARLAIYASQSSLNVTGNNIANINTKGYTRQRMDLVSLYPTGEARYANNYNLSIGYGVLCDSVSQLRDPFLDIRYRNENASTGAYQARLEGLKQLSHKLDEVGKGTEGFGVIEDQLADFVQQLESLNGQTAIGEYDNLVRSSADELCKLFNTTAKGLQEIFENEEKYLEQNMDKVNSLLTQIRDLNEQIRAHNIYGDSALELKDARNVAIDELSSLMKIDVTYSMEKIDQFTEVEKLTITLPGTVDPAISKAEAMEQALADNIANLKDDLKTEYNDAATTAERKAEILADETSYKDSANFPKKWTDYNVSSNFDKPIKLIDGIYGTQVNIKKIYELNPDYQGKYVAQAGKGLNGFTDDPEEAEKETVNGVEGPKLNPNYKDDDTNGKYLDQYKEPTNDLEKADFHYDDKYLMDIDPLIDKRGKYMRDPKYGVQLTNSIDLKDNDLYGAIQSMRELLTEEGEFSNDYELGKNLENITDPEELKRALLYADENASTKRGIPYYMKALDHLAQQFAKTVNEINQPNKYVTGVDAKGQPIYSENGTLTYDMIYKTFEPTDGTDFDKVYKTNDAGEFVDSKGNPIEIVDGNGVTRNLTPADLADALRDEADAADAVDLQNIKNAKSYLATLQEKGDKNPVFVDKNNQPIKNIDGEDMTLADVRDATLDPTKPENYEKIQKAQKNMEILREAANFTDEWNFYLGGPLLSNAGNNNDPTGITASNISVSLDWGNSAVRVLNTVQPNDVDIMENGEKRITTHTTAGDNILHMVNALTQQRDFNAKDIEPDSASKRFYFRGSFQEFFTGLSGTLATDTNETTKLYNHYDLETVQLENDRQSISGVDLNEEATSMMQFQKSFSAACQLLTIIDSMLDKLINGTI